MHSVSAVAGLAFLTMLGPAGLAQTPATASPQSVSFLGSTPAELARSVPDLRNLQIGEPVSLEPVLEAIGQTTAKAFADLVDISFAEDILEIRSDDDAMVVDARQDAFRYVLRPFSKGSVGRVEEFRTTANDQTRVIKPDSRGGLVQAGHLFESLNRFLPQYQAQQRFRYLGRDTINGVDALVVAFAELPGRAHAGSPLMTGPDGQEVALQGLAWLDAKTARILRIRLSLLGPLQGALRAMTLDIRFVPVGFKSLESVYSLPANATLEMQYEGLGVLNVHRFSDFHLYGFDDQADPVLKAQNSGMPATPPEWSGNANELLGRWILLSRAGKKAEALQLLRQAKELDPQNGRVRYHLGVALREANDLPAAEIEFRESIRLYPLSAAPRNGLGIVLFKRGNLEEAATEFRSVSKLAPKTAAAHANLAEVLSKLGDKPAALEEYRVAVALAPDDTTIKGRMEALAAAPDIPTVSPPAPAVIRVDVRQVLVPVIVKDREGHQVPGLTQADFKVFEDGTEQKISAFSAQSEGLNASPVTPGVAGRLSPPPDISPAHRTPRAYVICIDALHTSAANLMDVREALRKFLREEKPGDSQYALISIGRSVEILQNTTHDPANVLKAVQNPSFQKVFLQSKGKSELTEFLSALNDARSTCDSPQGRSLCPMKKKLVAQTADRIAQQDEMLTRVFLDQLRSVLEPMSRGTGRRTLVLISDGFQIVPGREAYSVLAAFFPDIRGVSLRTTERMQAALDPVLRIAAKNNIPVYTIDSRGLYTDSFLDASSPGVSSYVGPAVQSAMNDNATADGATLMEISAATGGTAFHGRNDILKGLQQAFADGRDYYLISYVPTNTDLDGRFRTITVQVREKNAVVIAKRGYWATEN
jgi:VWFA-related protein